MLLLIFAFLHFAFPLLLFIMLPFSTQTEHKLLFLQCDLSKRDGILTVELQSK